MRKTYVLNIGGPERWFCGTETSSPVITLLCIYKKAVSDEKYCIFFEHIPTALYSLYICNIAPEDGLIQSETCPASENKDQLQESVHLVGSSPYQIYRLIEDNFLRPRGATYDRPSC